MMEIAEQEERINAGDRVAVLSTLHLFSLYFLIRFRSGRKSKENSLGRSIGWHHEHYNIHLKHLPLDLGPGPTPMPRGPVT
jgi:hypothetical protein